MHDLPGKVGCYKLSPTLLSASTCISIGRCLDRQICADLSRVILVWLVCGFKFSFVLNFLSPLAFVCDFRPSC